MAVRRGTEGARKIEIMSLADAEKRSVNYPEWTEYRKKNGLDPLGMRNSSVSLYQTLLPGISNVTLRIRYYGLYVWLSQTYARHIGDTDPETWKRFVRRTEALYALIACRAGGESGVAGIEWAQRTLDAAETDAVDFAADAEPGSETYYLKQAWGAFGAAYRSQLFEIGIFDPADDHDIPLPSKPIGENLAQAFADSLRDLASLLFAVIQRGTVTKSELDHLVPAVPSAIAWNSAERVLYQDILLCRDESPAATALSRRRSVLLILKIAALLGRDPQPDEVRWILYAGCDRDGRTFALNDPALEAQRTHWWVYHANDLCHIACETLLKFTLDALGTYPAGISLSRLIPLCIDQLVQTMEDTPARWAAFMENLQPATNAYDKRNPHSEATLTDIIIHAGRSGETICTPEAATKAITLLAILHRRVRDEGHDLAIPLGRVDRDAFRSLLSETRFLDRQSDEDFRSTLGALLEERVIRRHLWVALRKLRHQGDYTFLIETDDGRLRLREKDGPVFTNPRLGPAITFLRDIYLLDESGLTYHGIEAVSA